MQNKFAAKELTRVDFLFDKTGKQVILIYRKRGAKWLKL
jgi:hypothetical protein